MTIKWIDKEQDQLDIAIKEIFEMTLKQYYYNEESPNIKMNPQYIETIRERALEAIKPLIDMKIYLAEHSVNKTIVVDREGKLIKEMTK